MSTEAGGKLWADDAVRDAKGQVERVSEQRQVQYDFLPTPEEMSEAHHALATGGKKKVTARDALTEARRRGRPAGSRNRRTDDFARWILAHGQHPAVTLMQIQATPPEVLVERSAAIDPQKKRMSYGDAQNLRARCADILMPYLEGKKPISVAIDAKGDFNLLIPGLNISHADARAAADGDFVIDGQLVEYRGEDDEGQANG